MGRSPSFIPEIKAFTARFLSCALLGEESKEYTADGPVGWGSTDPWIGEETERAAAFFLLDGIRSMSYTFRHNKPP